MRVNHDLCAARQVQVASSCPVPPPNQRTDIQVVHPLRLAESETTPLWILPVIPLARACDLHGDQKIFSEPQRQMDGAGGSTGK